MAMGGGIMDFVQRFQSLQLQRDTSDELIKVGYIKNKVRNPLFLSWPADLPVFLRTFSSMPNEWKLDYDKKTLDFKANCPTPDWT